MNNEYQLLRTKFSSEDSVRIAKYNSKIITNFCRFLKEKKYSSESILQILKQLQNDQDSRINIFFKLSEVQVSEKTLITILNFLENKINVDYYDTVVFTKGQIQSKKWITNILNLIVDNKVCICIVGSWFSLLAKFLFDFSTFEIEKITGVDIDQTCFEPSLLINKDEKRFEMIIQDMFKFDYSKYDIIINTSCEHINLDKWIQLIPKKKIVVLQSCDLDIQEHINIVHSTKEFLKQCQLKKNLYSSHRILNEYTRFMIIGET